MKNNNSDFISLTAAVRRAKSEGLNLSYAGLRRFVAEGFIPHVPNGSHILVYYPNVVNLLKNGVTAEQSRLISFPVAAANPTICPRHHPDVGDIFETGGSNLCSVKIAVIKSQIPLNSALPAVIPLAQRHPPVQ